MKEKEIPSDPDGIRLQAGPVAGNGNLAIRTERIRPQPGSRIFRLLHHPGIGKRSVDGMLQLKNTVFVNIRIHREKAADLSCLPVPAPALRHVLGILTPSQAVGCNGKDQKQQKGYSSAYSKYYFLHFSPHFHRN